MKDSEKNRVKKYFNEKTSNDEDFIIDSFYKKENETHLNEIAQNHWEESSNKTINLQHILNSIHFNINSEAKKSKKFLIAYQRIAAILIIPLIIAGVLWSLQKNSGISFSELTAPKGSRVQFTLPDGSNGFLNSGSTIKYATNFNTERNIELKGEAYFNVKEDTRSPFTVKTKHAAIKVLGTSFDVCAYRSDTEIMTTLENGSVEITNHITSKKTTIKPGQQNRINTSSGKMETLQVETHLYTSWKENALRFDNAPFNEVVKKMERWYGVKIILDKNLIGSENYTMTIKTESIREMLQLLQLTIPLKYSIENDTVTIKSK